jgi:glycosyltransferase 2 family protein
MPLPPASSPAEHAAAHRRRIVVWAIKLAIAVGILAFLFTRLRGEDVFERLVDGPKHWGLLAAAQALVVTGLTINYVRWYVLGHALGLDFSLRDALRLGSLGLLLNQVSPGSIGGDLFKAVFIAREQPGKRTEAVASVLIDRVVGFYAMILVATAGYYAAAERMALSTTVHALGRTVAGLAIAGAVGIGLLMTPWFTGPRVRDQLARLPVVGGTLARLVEAAGAYRHHRGRLLAGVLMGCCTHTLFVLAFWYIGRGLPVTAPPLAATFVVAPMSLAAGAIPLTPSGLGVAEAAVGQLYEAVGCPASDGYLVGLTYRVMTYVMAAVGAVYYLNARRTVTQVLHEAEELADEGAELPS